MGSQPRELQPNNISLLESLGIDFFEALFHFITSSLTNGANIEPILPTIELEPTPTLRTTVGYISAE